MSNGIMINFCCSIILVNICYMSHTGIKCYENKHSILYTVVALKLFLIFMSYS